MSASDVNAAFFCDLDQTAIFSRRMVDTYSEKDYSGLVAVESLESPVAFMKLEALELLQQLSKDLHFIPVTTRGARQYVRLKFPKVEINHWIMNNGGRIFFNKEEDLEWRDRVVKQAENDSESPQYILDQLEKDADLLGVKLRKQSTDGVYLSLYAEDAVTPEFVKYMTANAEKWNYILSVQSKGVYLVPSNVTKQAAAEYLAQKLQVEKTYASGDSVFDLSLMQWADAAIKPNHGELWELGEGSDIRTTPSQGVQAGKEILDFVVSEYLAAQR